VRGSTALSERFQTANPNLVVIVEKPGGSVADADAAAIGREATAKMQASDGVVVVGSYWATGAPELRSQQGDAGLILARVAGNEDDRAGRPNRAPAYSAGPLLRAGTGPVRRTHPTQQRHQPTDHR
jgi:RND superfamily putative drug exporter